MYIVLHVKYALIMSDFSETLVVWTGSRKNIQTPNNLKIIINIYIYIYIYTGCPTS